MQQKYKGNPTTRLAFRSVKIDDLVDLSIVQLMPAFAAGLKRSGKPVRQHALVSTFVRHRPTVLFMDSHSSVRLAFNL